MIAQCFVELVGNLMKWVSPAPDMISVVDSDKGREQTVKLGGGCMTIMERMALRLEGPTFSLHTSRGTSTACAICTHTHTHTHTHTQAWILTTKGVCTCLSFANVLLVT